MSALIIRILFIIFFSLQYIWETLLTVLNIRNIEANKNEPPLFIKDLINNEIYNKTVHYSITKSRFSLIQASVSAIFVLFIVLSGLFGIIDNFIEGLNLGLYWEGIIFIYIISLIFGIFSLPFSLYSQFVIEERFGFNKMSLGLFIMDRLKALIISIIIMTPLLLGLFWFIETSGKLWWIWAFGFYTLFQLIIVFLYPRIIAPLFNKFTPINQGSLKQKINKLLEKINYKTKGIFKMDGSKRSKHSNAYFTGLGKTKRVVLFDTLIGTLGEDQIIAVLAHELGHDKKKHIQKSLVLSLLGMLLAFFILSLLLNYAPLYHAFGFTRVSYHGILVLLSLCGGAFTFFLKPLFSILSRKHEYEADKFTADTIEKGALYLKQALLTLSRDNLSNLTPHPWYSFYHYSHPTLAERISALDKLS